MARDQYEYDVGGQLRDRYGRRQMVIVGKHAAPGPTDGQQGYEPSDPDGREQIVIPTLIDANGNFVPPVTITAAQIESAVDSRYVHQDGTGLPTGIVNDSRLLTAAAGDVALRQPGGGWAPAAATTPAMVAHTAAASTSGSAVTTAAIDTTGATLLVAALAWKTSATPAITGSKGNTWTVLPTQTGSDGSKLALAVCTAPTVGSGHTFTATGAASSFPSIAVQAFSGTQGNAADVNVGTAASAVSSISTGAFTLAVEGEIVIAATGAATNADTFAVDRGWTIPDQLPGVTGQSMALAMACRWRPTNSTARNAGHFPTWTGGSSAVREAVLASFK